MRNILVADSDYSSADQLCEYFTKRKFLAVPAYSGIDALVSAHTIHPDIIITDAFLPGLDTALLMRNLSHLRTAPKFIIRSVQTTQPFCGNFKNLGTYHVISRSEPVSRIGALVTELLAGKISESLNDARTEAAITGVLNALGIPAAMSGYKYLHYAIRLCLDTPQIADSMTRSVYPTIALHFGVSPQNVEAAMRNAVKKCWRNGTPQFAAASLHISPGSRRPCNTAFITLVANYVRNMIL